MKRACVLSSGAAWCAFQIGALEHLIAEREYDFDICAGTGIGAMNAAFVACGEFGALKEFWEDISWLKLLSFNWKHPFRDGLFSGKGQRQFIEKHISEDKLRKKNRVLVFSTLNISTGEQVYFTYPGSDVPLVDALMGAAAVPGLTPPFNHKNGPLAEGTFVNSFILDYIITHVEADEYVGIAPLPSGKSEYVQSRKYTHWRESLRRTLQINLSRDINNGFKRARNKVEVMHCYQGYKKELDKKIGDQLENEDARQKVYKQLDQHFNKTNYRFYRKRVPELYEITSEKEIESPLSSFRKKNIRQLKSQGYTMAQKIIS